MVAGLLAVLTLEVGKNLTSVRGPGLVAIGVAGGVAGGLLYASWDGLKLWLRYLAPAPLVFALVFLLISPVSKLVLPQPGGTVDANAPGVRINPEHPVVMVLLDEFPVTSLLNSKSQVDARLYPNFAKLAGRSTWYRNATAVSGLTNWAVPAMLSGRYPTKAQEEASPTAAQYPDHLFTLLGRSYPVEQFQVVTQLCPADVCKPTKDSGPSGAGLKTTLRDSARVFKRIVWPRDADENPTGAWLTADPEADAKPAVKPGDSPILKEIEQGNEPRQYYNFVQSIEGTDAPTFYFLHMLLPHQPWHYLPDGRKYTDRGDPRAGAAPAVAPAPPDAARRDRPADRPGHAAAPGAGHVRQDPVRRHRRPRHELQAQGVRPPGGHPGQRRPGPVGAAVHQDPRPERGAGHRPQLGARRPGPDRGRPARDQGPLGAGRRLPGRRRGAPEPQGEMVLLQARRAPGLPRPREPGQGSARRHRPAAQAGRRLQGL